MKIIKKPFKKSAKVVKKVGKAIKNMFKSSDVVDDEAASGSSSSAPATPTVSSTTLTSASSSDIETPKVQYTDFVDELKQVLAYRAILRDNVEWLMIHVEMEAELRFGGQEPSYTEHEVEPQPTLNSGNLAIIGHKLVLPWREARTAAVDDATDDLPADAMVPGNNDMSKVVLSIMMAWLAFLIQFLMA